MKRAALFGALVVFSVLAAFSPALDNGFVGWDDDVYILENESLRGLPAARVKSAFTSTRMGHYHPLTWLSYGVDYSLGGLEPSVYHAGNVLLHALAALFFFMACRVLFGEERAAAAAALFFALHPLRVESVAWASERKDVLAAAFLCAAFWAHLARRRVLCAALFAASLGSKAAGMAFPFALLLLDAYRRGRLDRRDLMEKAPLFALAAASAALSLWALHEGNMLSDLDQRGPALRLGQAAYGFWFYLWKTLLPVGLLPHYAPPAWFGRWFPALALAAPALAAFYLLFRLRRREPILAVSAYVVLAAPILGAVQSGVPYAACDRYSYLPALPLSLLAGAAFLRAPALRLAGACALALSFGLLTWRQCGIWRDTERLWTVVVRAQPENALALQNLGVLRFRQGRFGEAEDYMRRAVGGRPLMAEAFECLGTLLNRTGRSAEAESALARGIALKGRSATLKARLGRILAERGDPQAEPLLRAALSAGEPSAGVDLGRSLAARGRIEEAISVYREVLAVQPRAAEAHNNLGLLLEASGRGDEARHHYRMALREKESRAIAHYNLGNWYLARGEADSAIRQYMLSGTARADVNHANILAQRGRVRAAESLYRRAIKKAPDLREARFNLEALRAFRR